MSPINDLIVFDPRGVVETEPLALAGRACRPEWAAPGRARQHQMERQSRCCARPLQGLQEEFSFAAVNYYRKESFSKDADPALIETIAANNDIVLTAIGD